MSSRRVRMVLLCEDSQHEAFVRRFLKARGKNTREMRVEKAPKAGKSAEQFVRERFPLELEEYRKRSSRAASSLVAVVDADAKTVDQRLMELQEACTACGTVFRRQKEAVAIAVPRRNIETWIKYLEGVDVDEEQVYDKLTRERECRVAARELARMCDSGGVSNTAPDSLQRACAEYAGANI